MTSHWVKESGSDKHVCSLFFSTPPWMEVVGVMAGDAGPLLTGTCEPSPVRLLTSPTKPMHHSSKALASGMSSAYCATKLNLKRPAAASQAALQDPAIADHLHKFRAQFQDLLQVGSTSLIPASQTVQSMACPYCGVTYAGQQALNGHIGRKHK